MDNSATFLTFLQTRCGVTIASASDEIVEFVSTLRNLLSVRESQLENFVKSTHSANSASTAQQGIFIPLGAIKVLKAIHFELES